MTDGTIKGTGNSRFFRTVPNALTLYPTYESFLEAAVAGTLPFDLNGINPAGWAVVGDKLDKATLLTDTLCTDLGLATTATPTQAMDKLRTLISTAQTTADGRVRATKISYTGTGATTKTISFAAQPIVVFITSNASPDTYGWVSKPNVCTLIYGQPYGVTAFSYNVTRMLGATLSWGTKSLTLTAPSGSSSGDEIACNSTSKTYYVAYLY